ncbi:glycosyltransferase family 39 protein, partial [Candidatus Fermentibacterales bacterium]|nr:glycosyltransferase family 39 protein [Candidatus Fermentibacterales bacterium]
DGRGEQAMGHPAGFFWLWAVLIRMLGNTLLTARILPAFATFLALSGIYLLGRRLLGRELGLVSMVCLAFSPLFVSQSFVPLPDTAMLAMATLSLFFYASSRTVPASLFCLLAVMCREQAVLLAATYIAIEIVRWIWGGDAGRRPRLRSLALFCLPLAGLAGTWLCNLLFNGYLINRNYSGAPPAPMQGWLGYRTRLFLGHLMTGDLRWLPTVVALALLSGRALSRRSRRPDAGVLPPIVALVLLFPALVLPHDRLLGLAVMVLIAAVPAAKAFGPWLRGPALTAEDRLVPAMLLFGGLMVGFHVTVVLVAPDPQLDLVRYVLACYPVFIVLPLFYVRKLGGRSLFLSISAIFALGTLLSGLDVPATPQADAGPRGFAVPLQLRSAAGLVASERPGDTLLVEGTDVQLFTDPALGYVGSPIPTRSFGPGAAAPAPGIGYSLITTRSAFEASREGRALLESLPEGTSIRLARTFSDGSYTTSVYFLEAAGDGARQGPPDP